MLYIKKHKKWLLLAAITPSTFADVILCTGMSNAQQECAHWIANNATEHQIINGAAKGFDIVKIHNNPDTYWNTVLEKISASGYSADDIDIIWNKNATRASSGDVVIERQLLHDYFIEFQSVAEGLFPNLQAGYHSPRTTGEYCNLNPEPFASDTVNAIIGIGDSSGAVTHFDKWHFGPDISTPDFRRSDFTDGCHPSASGLKKTTPILNAFFSTTPTPSEARNPVARTSGVRQFTVSWEGEGSTLSCLEKDFQVSGSSRRLHIPLDLPYGQLHRCRIDQSSYSNKFGCRSSGNCLVK